MGDAGEGLIDAESRIQERMEELARERAKTQQQLTTNTESLRAIGSLKLAQIDLERQRAGTAHEGRRSVIEQAITEINRRISALGGA